MKSRTVRAPITLSKLARLMNGQRKKLAVIVGTVTDDKNSPLKGVEVKAINTKNEELVYKTYTDKEGKYIFNKLPKGKYKVSYSIK